MPRVGSSELSLQDLVSLKRVKTAHGISGPTKYDNPPE